MVVIISAVDIGSVTKADDKDVEPTVLNIADNSVVTNAIAPETAKGAGQSFSHLAGIIGGGYTLIHEIEEASGNRLIELTKLVNGRCRVLNRPSQGPFSHQSRCKPILGLCEPVRVRQWLNSSLPSH